VPGSSPAPALHSEQQFSAAARDVQQQLREVAGRKLQMLRGSLSVGLWGSDAGSDAAESSRAIIRAPLDMAAAHADAGSGVAGSRLSVLFSAAADYSAARAQHMRQLLSANAQGHAATSAAPI
jgi:hypothetical protein